jgi:alkanesulfonate monooxygenase
MFGDDIQVFTTCPQSKNHTQNEYLGRVREVSRWSDAAGCSGMLIYSDNSIIDPWLVAQLVTQETRYLAPLVALQPVYMHPYTAAKMVASLGFMYRRRIWLNMIAGGFRNDLFALGDCTEHDQRYARLVEYADIVRRLLVGETVNHQGDFYRIQGLRMTPLLPSLEPQFLMSGSSRASRAAAIQIGATAVEYPEPNPPQYADVPPRRGIRVGIIADKNAGQAWQIAHQRFPPDRRGQLQHEIAIRVSDSAWQKTLGALAAQECKPDNPYWLWPFKNYQTFCPYLVGDYEVVATEISKFLNLGYRTFILDIPRDRNDLDMASEVFKRAITGT